MERGGVGDDVGLGEVAQFVRGARAAKRIGSERMGEPAGAGAGIGRVAGTRAEGEEQRERVSVWVGGAVHDGTYGMLGGAATSTAGFSAGVGVRSGCTQKEEQDLMVRQFEDTSELIISHFKNLAAR